MNWRIWLIEHTTQRPPDFVIGGHQRPYLRRWWLTPWRRWTEAVKGHPSRIVRALGRLAELLPNAYLHEFCRSDDDRALHDHPWANLSVLLRGSYFEHTIAAGGIERRQLLTAGDWRVRWSGRFAHRIELLTVGDYVASQPDNTSPLHCWTLFVTGPRYRAWGFHCPEQGWIPWQRFTAADDPGAIGKGCDA